MTDELKAKLKTLPSSPGVYFHKNKAGEIIYVGKAAVLKNRVRQYFHHDLKDAKTEALKKEIYDTDWIVVDTEMDALFLESEMIKRYRPKWNILLRDDKTVSYVRIDLESEIPYVSVTRQPLGDDAEYIGPFYAKITINRALRILRKIFPYYDKPYDGKKTLNTDLRLTPRIEVGESSPKEYKENLKKLIRYLEGDRKTLIEELKTEMEYESSRENFERAAKLRNEYFGLLELKKKIVFSDKEFLDISSDRSLKELQKLFKLKTPPKRIECYDISHQSGTNVVASMVVFTNGVSDRSEYRKFKLKNQQNNDTESLAEVISRRIKHTEWNYPDLIILDGGIPQVSMVKKILDENNLSIPLLGRDKSGNHSKSASVKIIIPKDDSFRLKTLSPNSHVARLIARVDEESHRFAITYHTLLKRKELLK